MRDEQWYLPPRKWPIPRMAVGISTTPNDTQTALVLDGHAVYMRGHARLHRAAAERMILVPIQLEAAQEATLRDVVETVWLRYERNGIPWGIAYEGTAFQPDGELVLGRGCTGLTCATFIMALFSAAGVELIDTAAWPFRSDPAIMAARIARVERVAPEGERREMLRREVLVSKMYLPEDVAAAASLPRGSSFEEVQARADEVRAALRAHVTKRPV